MKQHYLTALTIALALVFSGCGTLTSSNPTVPLLNGETPLDQSVADAVLAIEKNQQRSTAQNDSTLIDQLYNAPQSVIANLAQKYDAQNPNDGANILNELAKRVPTQTRGYPFNNLNVIERALVLAYPLQAWAVSEARKDAERERPNRFGPDADDDAGNAFKHAYWNASISSRLYAMRIGVTAWGARWWTMVWTNAHECLYSDNTINYSCDSNWAGQNLMSHIMDLQNNWSGRVSWYSDTGRSDLVGYLERGVRNGGQNFVVVRTNQTCGSQVPNSASQNGNSYYEIWSEFFFRC
jgi:hypothetical protein